MTRSWTFLFLLFAATTALADNHLLRLHGSNTIGDKLAPVLAEKWLKSKGYTQVSVRDIAADERLVVGRDNAGHEFLVEIHAHGSSTAFADLASGSTDIGMASRQIKPGEVADLAKLGKMNDVRSEYVIGLDGVAVIVNFDNPITTLDKNTLRRIFSGELRDWSQLGGKPGAIHVLARDDKSGTYDTFKSLVLENGGSRLTGDASRYEASVELVDRVKADPHAIGFVGLAYTDGVKPLAISDGGAAIVPESFSVATEAYALARRLYLYVPTYGERWQVAQEFARFAVSTVGQLALEPNGFISQEIEARHVALPADAPVEYAQFTREAHRLSLNFRFEKGAFDLDNKAKRDMARLAAYFAKPENAHRKLLLFGFADSHEIMPIKSLVLSVERADTVADLLIANGLRPYRVRGYGSAVEVASNSSDSGRHRNRRVEVWVQ